MKNMNIHISKQSGFTLIELLVGLALSVFIITVAITYMVTSSRTFKVQTNEAMIQENARFALEILSQNLRLAGLNSSNNFLNNLEVVYSGAICPADESGSADDASGSTVCTRDGADNNTQNNSDRIAVDYMVDASRATADVTVNGCNSESITVTRGEELRLASVFWTADIDGDGVRSLYCQTYNLGDGTETGIGFAEGTALPLIDGVDRIQFQYGVDTDEDGTIERYLSMTNLADEISNNPSDPESASYILTTDVRSIRVSMLLNGGASQDQNFDTELEAERDYVLLDAPESSFTDGELRQIYSTTVLLPNGSPKL